MRYAIFSDIHSNLEALDEVISAYGQESIDEYLCIGDVVGYAANTCECVEKVREIAKITVAGNHDWAAVNLFSIDFFNEYAKEAIHWTKRNVSDAEINLLESLKLTYKSAGFILVHGTLDYPQDFNYMTDGFIAEETFKLMQEDLCFVGHTHKPAIFMKDAKGHIHYREDDSCEIKPGNEYIVNVGSVGQPRDGKPKAAYCVYDTDKKEIVIKRVSYDNELTKKKIIDSGLPKFLGDRLMMGR